MSVEYLAGFFDGEGCISIMRFGKSSYRVRLQVKQRSDRIQVLRLFQLAFGGTVNYRSCLHSFSMSKPQVVWGLNSRCSVALEAMLPFLILKKAEAKMALAFIATNPNCHYGNARVSSDVIAYREMFKLKLENLKQYMEVS